MNKGTLKVIIITVFCTLLSVGIIGAAALPHVVDKVKTEAVANYSDEYDELSYILGQSAEPVIQPNYIITGLIMSPDFQEYLDEGVQNGWWTEEFLEQFLIDEALPIFFTNYHALFSVILSSDPVQDTAKKLTIIKAKAQEIIEQIISKLRVLSNVLNNNAGTIQNIKGLIGKLKANKDQIASLIQTLKGIDVSKIQGLTAKLGTLKDNLTGLTGKLQALKSTIEGASGSISDVKEKLAAVKTKLGAVEKTLTDIKSTIDNLDVDAIKSSIDDLKGAVSDLKDALDKLDMDKVKEILGQIKDIVDKLEALDFDAIKAKVDDIGKLVDKLENIDKDELAKTIEQIKDAVDKLQKLIDKIENDGFDGIVQQILENILGSDAVQDILDNLELTFDNIIKLINFYFTHFKDIDYDVNWYNPITINIPDKDPITIDLSDYAFLLNVLDVYIPNDGYEVRKATEADGVTEKNVIIISKVYVGFEVGDTPTTNVLDKPVVIGSGTNLIELKAKVSAAVVAVNKAI